MPEPDLAEPDAIGREPGRRLRADARHNRDTILAVARDAFAAAGEDTPPLEAIARRAGVGIGTLYRHFPTREALVETVYATELDEVAASAPQLLDKLAPDAALREWLNRYAQFWTVKRGMITTLRAGWSAGRITQRTRERVSDAIGTILAAGVRSGHLRSDVDPDDVTAMLLGVFLSTASTASTGSDRSLQRRDPERRNPEQVSRLLDLIVDALRS